MAILDISARRMLVAGGFALAVAAAPAIATFAAIAPAGAAPAACQAGEEADLYTGACLPHTVPNTTLTGPFHTMPGNPQVPMVGNIPCTPMREVQCIGLAQNEVHVPRPAPKVTYGQQGR